MGELSMKNVYEIVVVEERILLDDLRRVRRNSRLHDIRYKKRVPKKPPEPDIQITANGYLHYRKDGLIFSCDLTGREQELVKAILNAKDCVLDDSFAVFQLDVWKTRDKNIMKGIIGVLNRKINRKGVPLKIVSKEWRVQFCTPR